MKLNPEPQTIKINKMSFRNVSKLCNNTVKTFFPLKRRVLNEDED